MKTRSNADQAQGRIPNGTKLSLLGLVALMMTAGVSAGVAAGVTFNNVQIFVNTAANLPYSYTFTAYNLTGSLVGTYQGAFPAAGFELPTGDYLFTVSAIYQSYTPCLQCAYPVGVSTGVSGAPASSGTTTTATSNKSSLPIAYYQPASEYGYAVAHVDSAQTLNIDTQNVTQFPTTQLTVSVAYVNGTAASGVSVSASVVGQWYYWWGQDAGTIMYAQTGSDGVANLVVPKAPVVVTAWSWIPVNLPKNETTQVTNVGGEQVNVTVYWQPAYVGLSASALVTPPTDRVNLTLHYQQPSYWNLPPGVEYASGKSSGAPSSTTASQPSGVPDQVMQTQTSSLQAGQSQYYLPSQIPGLQAQGASGPAGVGFPALTVAAAAALFAALAAAVVVLAKKRGPSAL
jgi:hypothetical protein